MLSRARSPGLAIICSGSFFLTGLTFYLQINMPSSPTVDLAQNPADDWWIGAIEIDTTHIMSLDGEGGLWSSAFVPPPPRPDFLDEDTMTDGVTTCDLCTWAWHHPAGADGLGKSAVASFAAPSEPNASINRNAGILSLSIGYYVIDNQARYRKLLLYNKTF